MRASPVEIPADKMNDIAIIPNLIYEIRGQKVMLDSDLARLYGVEVKVLNQTVKRNSERFPADFMFQLSDIEWKSLRSQIVTFKSDSRKYLPYAFTENGVAMLSSVLNSRRAIEVNIAIMRVFTNIRQFMLQQASKIDEIKELKKMLLLHIDNTDNRFNEHNEKINKIIQVLNNLIARPVPSKRIGFNADKD